jgi:hypothetical protein
MKCSDCNSAIDGEKALQYAKRYAWLREHFGELVIDTDGGSPKREVLRVEVRMDLTPVDAASLDTAVDAAMLPAA